MITTGKLVILLALSVMVRALGIIQIQCATPVREMGCFLWRAFTLFTVLLMLLLNEDIFANRSGNGKLNAPREFGIGSRKIHALPLAEEIGGNWASPLRGRVGQFLTTENS